MGKKKARKGESAGHPIEDGEFQTRASRDQDRYVAASTVEPGVAVNVLSDADVRPDYGSRHVAQIPRRTTGMS